MLSVVAQLLLMMLLFDMVLKYDYVFNVYFWCGMHIYRIMKYRRFRELFEFNKNVLVSPSLWKDKFENLFLNRCFYYQGSKVDFAFADSVAGQCWTYDAYSEAMWGIYANNTSERYVRIRTTPDLLLNSLKDAVSRQNHHKCFLESVKYLKTSRIETLLCDPDNYLYLNTGFIVNSLSVKRRAFRHEKEVRLLYLGDEGEVGADGLFQYSIAPQALITQVMLDPNVSLKEWPSYRAELRALVGSGVRVLRSKIYDPPDWPPVVLEV